MCQVTLNIVISLAVPLIEGPGVRVVIKQSKLIGSMSLQINMIYGLQVLIYFTGGHYA